MNANGELVGSNFYWLSTKPETIDWAKSTWWMTPTESYADFTALAQIPKVKLRVNDRTERKGDESVTHVTVENPSKSLAFFVRLKVEKGARGEEILPIVWEDNYISLLPGETREVTATYRTSELNGQKPVIDVRGWNVE
jgi:exo-1,4-beta-D-glucosaminidase